MREYVVKGGRPLRLGYTTGSCATAAASAAAEMLLGGESLEEVQITLPSGEPVAFVIDDIEISALKASCSVRKDAGDDPDVTDGIKIYAECILHTTEAAPGLPPEAKPATVALPEAGGARVRLYAGEGIGLVTAGGLSVPNGEAAINPVPRKMIVQNVRAVSERRGFGGSLSVVISAPGGDSIALKTFNPRLGISGGISILGTTGLVEPMSEKAVVDTIKLLIDKRYLADPENILITPGNYGKAFCRDALGLDLDQAVKYSNFLGECLDYLVYKGFKRILLAGHLGKLVKAAGGIMNTHSSVADCRAEIISAHAACAGAKRELCRALMQAKTTDQALGLLKADGLDKAVFSGIQERLLAQLEQRLAYRLRDGQNPPEVGVIVFSQDHSAQNYEVVMQSDNAEGLTKLFAGARDD